MRLIDADEYDRNYAAITWLELEDGCIEVEHIPIADVPTIDAVPVKHAHWIHGGYACGENKYVCSACGGIEWRTGCKQMKYCMFCGAKMD